MIGISFAPAPLARLILHYYVDDLGIDVEGEQTLDINLWKGIITFGPANFRLGKSDPGQVTKLGLDFSLRSLLGKRALVTTLIIDGLNLKLTENAQGELALNGVPLTGLLASEEEATKTKEKEKSSWGAGLDSFELHNSKLQFVTPQDRQADLAIEQLSLIGFRTWQPDEPGSFSLAGQLNGMPVSAEGEARPFAEEIQVSLRYQINDIELAKVEQLTGPLGLDRSAGRMQLQGAGEISQLFKGGTRISSSGEMAVDGVDVSIPGSVGIAMPAAKSTFQLRTRIEADGRLESAGAIGLDATSGRLQVPGGPDVTFDHGSLPSTDVALSLSPDGGLAFKAAPALDIAKLALSGPINLTSDSAKLQLQDLDIASGTTATRIATGGTLKVAKLALATPAANGSSGFKLQAPTIDTTLADVVFKDENGKTQLIGSATTSANVAEVTLPASDKEQPWSATLNKLQLSTRDLALNIDGNTTQLQSALTATIGALTAEMAQPATQRGGRGQRTSAVARSQVSVAPIEIELPRFEMTQRPNDLQIATALRSRWTGAKGSLGDVPARPAFSLGQFDLSATSLSLAMAGQRLRVSGDAALSLADADARWESQLAASRESNAESKGTVGKLALNLSGLDVQTEGNSVTAKAAVGLDGSKISLRSSELDTVAGGQMAVDRLQTAVKEITIGRPPAPAWRVVLDATMDGLNTGQANTVPRMHAKTVEVRDLTLDDRGAVDADALIITKTDAAISRRWLERMGGDPAAEQVAKAAEEVVQRATKEKAPLRIGHLRVEDSAHVNFEDDVLRPPARFALKIEAFDMGELNSERPQGKTDLFLRARLNEFTQIDAQGWASPLAPKPDFALSTSVKYLQLPQLSPYTAQAIGLNIDSGRLQIKADATAQQGELQGVINLVANSLALTPVSAEIAGQAEKTIGVPINTALNLLEDSEGKITLSLPLSGNLASPSFDFGDVITLAMTNVVKGAVLAPFKMALLPLNLLVDAASGSAPKLAPITFDANTITPDAQGATILASLAKLLRDEEKLTVQVCGRTTLQDRTAALAKQALPPESDPIYPVAVADLRAGLGQLAQARTTAVRHALDEQYGIRRGRVLECRSYFDDQDNGPPRVEIKF